MGFLLLTSTRVLMLTALRVQDRTLGNAKRKRKSTHLVTTPVLIAYRQRLYTSESDLDKMLGTKVVQHSNF